MKKDKKQTKWPSSVRKKKCFKKTGLAILARLTRINKKDQKHSYLLSILVKKIDILSSQRNRQPSRHHKQPNIFMHNNKGNNGDSWRPVASRCNNPEWRCRVAGSNGLKKKKIINKRPEIIITLLTIGERLEFYEL
jgi:hypothetical protein